MDGRIKNQKCAKECGVEGKSTPTTTTWFVQIILGANGKKVVNNLMFLWSNKYWINSQLLDATEVINQEMNILCCFAAEMDWFVFVSTICVVLRVLEYLHPKLRRPLGHAQFTEHQTALASSLLNSSQAWRGRFIWLDDGIIAIPLCHLADVVMHLSPSPAPRPNDYWFFRSMSLLLRDSISPLEESVSSRVGR